MEGSLANTHLHQDHLRKPWAWITLMACACSSSEEGPPANARNVAPAAAATEDPETQEEGLKQAEADTHCADAFETHQAALARIAKAHDSCQFDHECVQVGTRTEQCYHGCPVVLHARGVGSLSSTIHSRDGCPQDCAPTPSSCTTNRVPDCVNDRCTLVPQTDYALDEVSPPDGNRPGSDASRPAPGDPEQEMAARLFEAIRHNDPNRALDFFFPKEAFHITKAIADPDGYWDRLFRRYQQDITALHESLLEELGPARLANAEFERLDIIRRGGFVRVREEGNALPYWVSRHSMLYYRAGEQSKRFEVRVLITWGDHWHITHLSEFH